MPIDARSPVARLVIASAAWCTAAIPLPARAQPEEGVVADKEAEEQNGSPNAEDSAQPEDSPEADETSPSEVVPAPRAETPPPEPAALEGARRLDAEGLFDAEQAAYTHYMEGQRALDAGDPNAAIAAWEQGVQTLPDERPYARSRGALALRLVLAHEARYRLEGDIADLRQQIALLGGYRARLSEMFPDDTELRQRKDQLATAQIERIEAEIDRTEGEHGTADEQLERSLRGDYVDRNDAAWGFDATDVAWHPRPDDPRKHEAQATDAEVAPEEIANADESPPLEPRKRGTGLIVTGALLTGAGIAGIAVGGAGMAAAAGANDFDEMQTPTDRRQQIADGNAANLRAVIGLSAGAALAVTGVVLIAVGAKRRKASPSALAVLPKLGRGRAGVVLQGSF